ncbi:aldo/keto reductase [Candidatus Caldatribacterium sp.]|uniref:aldo/keto reductase n=1 Tax=Candidatus Caldatribacterium sp. TaxID=2282143 RepID=UPI00299C461F|nr:aldo/keto reductase [Candidatus Caldatribacterium sp.]MDW8081706.1 aldo/keto reductase [Candidatus Calescibacterium sp.]
MNERVFGRCGVSVSEIGFGAWAIGGSWGYVDEKDAIEALHRAIDLGVNFIDTADVYGDGRSERLIGQVLKERRERVFVATKAGRRLSPHVPEGYTEENLARFVERSLKNLGVDTIDLLQLHCPPTPVYYMPEVFEALDRLVEQGKIRFYGVSVEKVEEALKAIEYPGVRSVQIIFNIFRQRPAELFFHEARKRRVAIIARVPLASGLLTGKITPETTFPPDDHRNFNREGQAFDRGETFAGVNLERAFQALEELKKLVPEGYTMAQFALKWILMFPEVTTVIPGAKNARQAEENARASSLPPLSEDVMKEVGRIYNTYIRADVHHRW